MLILGVVPTDVVVVCSWDAHSRIGFFRLIVAVLNNLMGSGGERACESVVGRGGGDIYVHRSTLYPP